MNLFQKWLLFILFIYWLSHILFAALNLDVYYISKYFRNIIYTIF